MKILARTLLALALASGLAAYAQDGQKRVIAFKPGEIGAEVKATVKGRDSADFTVRAKAGQVAAVVLKSANASVNFNVLPPGSEAALFIGSTSGNRYAGVLPKDGEYTVRVYLMGAASKQSKPVPFTVDVTVGDGKGG